VRRADKIQVPIFLKSESLKLESSGPIKVCTGIALLVLKSHRLRSKSFFYISFMVTSKCDLHPDFPQELRYIETLLSRAFLHLSLKFPGK
jgi:hypothetical protein